MQIRVLFFGMLKDWAGRSDDSLDLPDYPKENDVIFGRTPELWIHMRQLTEFPVPTLRRS